MVSNQARHLCERMLVVDERLRPTAEQCLRHHWFAQPAANAPALDASTLEALCQSSQQSSLQRAILMDLVITLNCTQVERLTEFFRACDLDGNGMLSAAELERALQAAGASEEIAARVAAASRGGMNYTEFLAATLSACDELVDDLLWAEFTKVDKDGSGSLDVTELAGMLESMDCGSRAIDIISKVDVSGDGRVQFDELLRHFGRRKRGGSASAPITTAVEVPAVGSAAQEDPSLAVDALLSELEGGPSPTCRHVVPKDVADALFDRADCDNDGVLQPAEFARWKSGGRRACRVKCVARSGLRWTSTSALSIATATASWTV